ncbi:MAG: transglutaminase domain-containing protein [Phycisphaera sp.]|nr:MAG: transglutaminase domain-containing protein [Phycisphaera sp.]
MKSALRIGTLAPRVCLNLLTMILVALPAGITAQPEERERYFVVMLDDQRAGWMRESTRIVDDQIISAGELHFELKRGAIQVAITLSSEFVETTDYEPVRVTSTQSMAALPVTTEVVFTEDSMDVSITQNGVTNKQSQPLPEGAWLTPGGAEEFFKRRLAAGAEEIELRTIEPMAGLAPIITTYTGFTEETIEVFGRDVPAVRANVTQSVAPGMSSIEHMDHSGRMLRSVTDMGGMRMNIVAADKELALAELDPPELMQSTFVSPIGEINRPRKTTKATYILSVPDGELADLPNLPSQTMTRIDDRTIRLKVTMGDEAIDDEEPGEIHLEASTMLDKDDPEIMKLTKRAQPSGDAPASIRAEAMRRAVFNHIDEKNLGVGIATASEVARTGVGDCTEHGTLLAAMLRADGIPSRTVSGLVFVENFEGSKDIFGYHMWTQAWIEEDGQGRWVDYDATLGPNNRYDATHIALAVSAMSDDDSTNSMITLVPLLGRLEIEIVEAK